MKICSIVLSVWCAYMSGAVADSFVGDEFSTHVDIATDSVVYENVLFRPGVVNVNDTLDFENNGRVYTTFSICDGCEIFIRNRGEFTADFVLGNNSKVVQVVSGTDAWNPIDADVKYTLMIDGAEGVSLENGFNGNALNNIILKDSVLDISDVILMGRINIDLRGDIVLVADDLTGLYDMPIIGNVSGNGRVRVVNKNSDVLYSDVAFLIDNQLLVKRVRETDYKKIFDNDLGVFLNNLRRQNSGNRLLRALDVATDMNSINGIMTRSVRMNPEFLLRPVRMLGEFNKIMTGARTGIAADFDVVFSDDFYTYGAGVGLSGIFDRLKLGLGLYVGDMEYESDLDSFRGVFYGLNMGADYLMKNNLFVRGMANVMRFDFDMGDVFYNGEIINNPSAIYVGGVADFGYRHKFADSFYVAPFVGMDTVGTIVADMSDINIRGRVGMDVGYAYQMLGLSYDYGIGVNANSDNEIMVNARAGFLSAYDGAGVNIGFAVSRMFDICSYKISIGGRAWF